MKKNILLSLLLSLSVMVISTNTLSAGENITGKDLAKDLELNPKRKVIKQWERVFNNERKMKRYGINSLSDEDREKLKEYLIQHAKDAIYEEN